MSENFIVRMEVISIILILQLLMSLSAISLKSELTLCSYNSRGHSDETVQYVKSLMTRCDVLLIQEHWLFNSELSDLESKIGNVFVTGISGMSDSELLKGRPRGGCAVVIKKDLKIGVQVVDNVCLNNRCHACVISVCSEKNTFKFLLFNMYMPCDDNQNNSSYDDILAEVGGVIDGNSDIDYIIIGGDMNTDLSRMNSLNTQSMKIFCEEQSLAPCITLSVANVDFTYESDTTGTRSTLDHFIVSQNLIGLVSYYESIHDGDNLSDHSPVSLKLRLDVEQSTCENAIYKSKTNWKCANQSEIDEYKQKLKFLLSQIRIPSDAVHCENRDCKQHNKALDEYHNDIVNACITAAMKSLPKRRRGKRVAGWTEQVQSLKDKSIFWTRIWVENGCPSSGILHEIKAKAKRDYKRASRSVIRKQNKLVSQRMGTAIANGNNRDLWGEVKRMQTASTSRPLVIDDAYGTDDICSLFKAQYSQLYNSVSYDEKDFEHIEQRLTQDKHKICGDNKCVNHHKFTSAVIKGAVNKLNSNKSDGSSGLYSDHILNGGDELFSHVADLFNAMVHHSYTPADMLLSTLVPIPKNRKKSLNSSQNYRSIALSSILGKVLDHAILKTYNSTFVTNDLQFGFKENHSTTQCSFVLREVIQHYVSKGSQCYVTFLDASKAFDRVDFIKLFELLIKRGLCPSIAKLLLNMYSRQRLRVNWNSKSSECFACTNGVKQGAVLSPLLFCLYFDELIMRLSKSQVGCHIGHHYVGALSYADDITLLSPSLSAAQKMMDVCQSFAQDYSVLFNPSKSGYLVFNEPPCHVDLKLNGAPLSKSECIKHLGCYIGTNSNNRNVNLACSNIKSRTNVIMSKFGSCTAETRNVLFKAYCTDYFGSPLWSLRSKDIDSFYCAWRKCIRRLWKLNYRTRSYHLPTVAECLPIREQMLKRFLHFFIKSINSTNKVVSTVSRLCEHSHSTVAANVRTVMSYANFNNDVIFNKDDGTSKLLCEFKFDMFVHEGSSLIRELCLVRDGMYDLHLYEDEVISIIDYVCTT